MTGRSRVSLLRPFLFRLASGFLLALGLLAGAHAAIPDSERQALLDLYVSTGGPGWTNSTGWNGAPGTECVWFGITCNGGHVVGVTLTNNNLTGTLPPLAGLPALADFWVNDNHLTGPIPALAGLTQLWNFWADATS